MTQTAIQHPAISQASIRSPESLAQENTDLRRQLTEQQDQLATLQARMDQLVDERIVELATLQEIDLQIHAHLDVEHVMNAVLDWAMWVTSAVAGTLYLIDEPDQRAVQRAQEQKTLRIVAQHGYQPPMQRDESQHWSIGQGILAQALETGRAIRRTHVSRDTTPANQPEQGRAHLAVPIQDQGTPIGLFGLESAIADGFTPAQIDSASQLADHASLAIQNALHHQQTRQHLDELLAVHTSCLELTSHLDLDTLPDVIVNSAHAVLAPNWVAVYRHDSATNTSTVAAAADRDDRRTTETDPAEQALVESAAQGRTACFAHDPTANARAALPLIAPTTQDIQGVLYLSFSARGHLPPEKSTLVQLFADYAASALDNAQEIARRQRALDAYQEHTSRIVNQSRAPLTSIQGYAKLMLRQIGGEITDQQRDFLETILKNAHDLEALITEPNVP